MARIVMLGLLGKRPVLGPMTTIDLNLYAYHVIGLVELTDISDGAYFES